MMEYKGYRAKVEFDDEDDTFHGRVLGLQDVVTFEGGSTAELRQAFQDSVDDYLTYCQSLGRDPEKPFSGNFVVRLDPFLHKEVATLATLENKSLNSLVVECLQSRLEEKGFAKSASGKPVRRKKPGTSRRRGSPS